MREREEDEIPYVTGTGEAIMDVPGTPAAGARRNEDIALDLMKFIAVTTGYGKANLLSGGVGFEKSPGGSEERMHKHWKATQTASTVKLASIASWSEFACRRINSPPDLH